MKLRSLKGAEILQQSDGKCKHCWMLASREGQGYDILKVP